MATHPAVAELHCLGADDRTRREEMIPRRVPMSVVEKIWRADPGSEVRLWSVVDNDTLTRAQSSGVILPNPDYLDKEEWSKFRRAYEWMRGQMSQRVPDYSGQHLVWAWLRRPSPRRGTRTRIPCSLVEIRVPRRRVLLSDYSLWHYPLNNWPISLTETESREQDSRRLRQDEIEETWQHIFDLSQVTDQVRSSWSGGWNRDVQACIADVLLSEVVSVCPWRPIRGCHWD